MCLVQADVCLLQEKDGYWRGHKEQGGFKRYGGAGLEEAQKDGKISHCFTRDKFNGCHLSY